MLNNINDKQHASNERKRQEAGELVHSAPEEVKTQEAPEKRKITFKDYEAFLDKLERDGRLEELSKRNPKAIEKMVEREFIANKEELQSKFRESL